ncbi:MAG: iron ABC transporter permease [Desulfuromonadales bacterium]|nr:iron ABC transporter permease [Desulfuromonadales bacterium]MDH3961019.1 iron ABC transporter permease [Desulfuromonadales bacterium]MDH4025387.1 iron ABC transporter permease [Desulfuromonadales bacterium]
MLGYSPVYKKLITVTLFLFVVLIVSVMLGLTIGSSGRTSDAWKVLLGSGGPDSTLEIIIWQLRWPRVVLAATVGATLSLGGLVFQALLRNPLAEPYILGISGGSAVGAILGILAGFSLFPGLTLSSFVGSLMVLSLVLLLSNRREGHSDSLLLAGVMVNAFCGAIIMFLISVSKTVQMQKIIFWLMGDLSSVGTDSLPLLLGVLPCFLVIFLLAQPLNLLLTGRESASAMGVNVAAVTLVLLLTASLMVSLTVCHSGLIGFVGLTIPHILRLALGSDHRILIPACVLTGASYLILCDLLARSLPSQGEMSVGIVTALVGAPLFIGLLWRSRQ